MECTISSLRASEKWNGVLSCTQRCEWKKIRARNQIKLARNIDPSHITNTPFWIISILGQILAPEGLFIFCICLSALLGHDRMPRTLQNWGPNFHFSLVLFLTIPLSYGTLMSPPFSVFTDLWISLVLPPHMVPEGLKTWINYTSRYIWK